MGPIAVSHILVQHRHEAEDLLRKLKDGTSFEDLARKHSTCPSAAQGGSLGRVDPRRFVDEFREALEGLVPGQLSGVVRTRFGHHVIRRDSND